MRIIRDYQFTTADDRGAVAAIGNFDGVHLGHQSVIDLTREIAQRENAPMGIMTFEPHPRELFQPDTAPFRVMNSEAKAHRLEKLGVDHLYELTFNHGLAGLSDEEFARDVIAGGLGLKHVIVGADFQFGKGRSGTVERLKSFGDTYGFDVTIAPLKSIDDVEISSTAIRKALTDGMPKAAANMLGHWHRIDGEVIRGDQRGRDLGFPTVNMSIEGLHPPRFGVYAVLVDVLTGPHVGSYLGAASVGVRPTFGVNTPNIETFIFDFSGDLYGAHLSVALVEYLRPELKFNGLQDLIEAMDDDCAKAREILAAL